MHRDIDDDDYISKSQLKRDAEELQQLGILLFELPASQYNQLDLPETLKQSMAAARKIKSHSALRRQFQLIGKQMRQMSDDDTRAIRHAIDEWQNGNKKVAQQFKQLENDRDLLIAGDNQLLEHYINQPNCSSQELRQLIRQAQKEQESGNKKAYKKLFQYLKTLSA